MTLADARHIWTDRDRPELARADAFVAWLDALPEPREAMGAASKLVDLLNEPLTILPRLAFDVACGLGLGVFADVAHQQVRLCPHGSRAWMADADSAVTGRHHCADCGGTTVAIKQLGAIDIDLSSGCALFSGPIPPTPPRWTTIDSRVRVLREQDQDQTVTLVYEPSSTTLLGVEAQFDQVDVTLGMASSDSFRWPIPPGSLTIARRADGHDVRCTEGVTVRSRGPGWLVPAEVSPASDRLLARSVVRTPLRTTLLIYGPMDETPPRGVVVDSLQAWGLMVYWVGFRASAFVAVGETLMLAFDRSVAVWRTPTGVVLEQRRPAWRFIEVLPGTATPLPIGDGTITWAGHRLEVRGCPPPVSRQPRLELATASLARLSRF
jgi:hypothetical protein